MEQCPQMSLGSGKWSKRGQGWLRLVLGMGRVCSCRGPKHPAAAALTKREREYLPQHLVLVYENFCEDLS
ncbi:hypothetical protein DV515_00008038 [Chloebia gouldiae]|uniref:Uncharacterized protein n=1 Tax=Chloebia gouldiae TaxID=44316 RepID=A0A3L8SI05_CHLGU|nr:hypothetical protein DV515_00008038 [Chloebia gouldiae]